MRFDVIDISELKNIPKDKIKMSYIISLSFFALIAYLLLFKSDFGYRNRMKYLLQENINNLNLVRRIAEYKNFITDFNQKYCVEHTNQLITIVTDAAKENNVIIELVKPLSDRKKAGYENIRVQIEGRAFYNNIGDFISTLENNEKFIFVESMELEAEDIIRREGSEEGVEMDFQESRESITYEGTQGKFKVIIRSISSRKIT